MPDLAGFALLLFSAAGIQGFFGFGFGIISMAILTLSRDVLVASGIVNLTAILLSVAMVAREHDRVLWPLVRRIVPPMLLGIAIGLMALGSLDRSWMARLLGLTIVVISAWNAAAPPLRAHDSPRLDAGVGLVAGVLSGAFNTGGPPLVVHLYRRSDPPLSLVVTLQAIFIGAGIVRAALAGAQGLIDGAAVSQAAIGAPFVVVGVIAGRALAHRTNPARFRRAAWLALGLLGIALLLDA